MKEDITQKLKDEHQLILRMLVLLEKNAQATAEGRFSDYRFYLDGVDFIRNFLSLPYRAYRKLPVFA